MPTSASTARHDGGAGSNIGNRLNKARDTLRMLNKVWKSSQYSTKTKLRRYLLTLLYELYVNIWLIVLCEKKRNGTLRNSTLRNGTLRNQTTITK